MKTRLATAMLALFVTLTAARIATAQDVPNKQAVLSQATQSYYSLRNEGLASFQCSITPNWESLLAEERKSNPAAIDAAIRVLSQLRFTVNVRPDQTATVTHNEVPAQNPEMQQGLRQIYGGMEQMTEGFFDTWKLFVFDHPFPAVNSDYRLEEADSTYRLTYKEDAANVVTVMGKDFAIKSLSVTTSQFDSGIRPSFIQTAKRTWLLNKYSAVYENGHKEQTTVLDMAMDYQTVNGFNLPRNLALSGSYGGTPFAVELTFSDCTAQRK